MMSTRTWFPIIPTLLSIGAAGCLLSLFVSTDLAPHRRDGPRRTVLAATAGKSHRSLSLKGFRDPKTVRLRPVVHADAGDPEAPADAGVAAGESAGVPGGIASFEKEPTNGLRCDSLEFPKRSMEEYEEYKKIWNNSVEFVIKRGLTFLSDRAKELHHRLIQDIERNGIPGMIIECGIAKAGSSIMIAAIKNPKRCLHLHDTFEGIPEPSEFDGPDVHLRYKKIQENKELCHQGSPKCNKSYYGNMDNLLEYDKEQFKLAGFAAEDNRVYFHKGLFDETVFPMDQVAYAHLDGDWYESTLHMLQRISPFMAIGGYFVLDDVFDWSGAREAYGDFFNVDLGWLNEQPSKKCLATQGKRQWIIQLQTKATAQLVSYDPMNVPRCQQKSNDYSSSPTMATREDEPLTSEESIKNRGACIREIRKRHRRDLFEGLFSDGHGHGAEDNNSSGIVLVDPAYHANLGDTLLTMGELKFVKDVMGRPVEQCHYRQAQGKFPHCSKVIDQNRQQQQERSRRRPIALWHAGGNWGDLYHQIQSERIKSLQYILERGYHVISMPQSLYYRDTKGMQHKDRRDIARCIALGLGIHDNDKKQVSEKLLLRLLGEEGNNNDGLNRTDIDAFVATARSRVTLAWRERWSYEKALELYPFVDNLLVPDIALQLGPYEPIRFPEDSSKMVDVFLLLRTDTESTIFKKETGPAQRTAEISRIFASVTMPESSSPPPTFRVADWGNRQEIFKSGDMFSIDTAIRLLSLGKVAIVDRLHAAILCYLSGIPFVYVDQESGKITKTFKWAIESTANITAAADGDGYCDGTGERSMWRSASSIEEAAKKAIEMIERHNLTNHVSS